MTQSVTSPPSIAALLKAFVGGRKQGLRHGDTERIAVFSLMIGSTVVDRIMGKLIGSSENLAGTAGRLPSYGPIQTKGQFRK
jgi:hypothetical protein